MIDLSDIPTFLQVGHPDREAAIERGAARLSANPRQPVSSYKKKTRIAPTAYQKKQTTKSTHASVKQQLLDVGYTPAYIAGISITRAKELIKDLIEGRGASREDI
jgi:hypothetical protein